MKIPYIFYKIQNFQGTPWASIIATCLIQLLRTGPLDLKSKSTLFTDTQPTCLTLFDHFWLITYYCDKKKSSIQETLHLSTDANSSTNTKTEKSCLFPWVSKIPNFQVGGREGGGQMRGLGSDSVILGPIRGQKNLHLMPQTDKQTNRQLDMATLWLNPPSGANSVKQSFCQI